MPRSLHAELVALAEAEGVSLNQLAGQRRLNEGVMRGGYSVFSQITTPGVRGVDLLYLVPDGSVLALEAKGTLRRDAIPSFRLPEAPLYVRG